MAFGTELKADKLGTRKKV